jgi:hypothetical protein
MSSASPDLVGSQPGKYNTATTAALLPVNDSAKQ